MKRVRELCLEGVGAYRVFCARLGANFILHLERTVGGLDVFLPYLRDYIQTMANKSITTQQWRGHLFSYFAKHDPEVVKKLEKVDWDVRLTRSALIVERQAC
jgi:leukotriene-A4 hydrolase